MDWEPRLAAFSPGAGFASLCRIPPPLTGPNPDQNPDADALQIAEELHSLYRRGLFPMAEACVPGARLLWFDPDPRARPPSAKAFAERPSLWRERPTAPPPITARLLRRESAAEPPQPSWALVLVVAGLAIALGLALGAVTRSQVDAPSPTPPPAARGGR